MTVKFSDLYSQWPIRGFFLDMAVFHDDPFGRIHNTHRCQQSKLIELGYDQLEIGTLVWFKKGKPGVDFLTVVSAADALKARSDMEVISG